VTIMAQEQIKFKLTSAKLVGSDTVNFRLEDETLVKVHVALERVGVAVDRKNPDGTPIYNISANLRMEFEPKDKIFYAPAPPMPTKGTNEKKEDKAYTR